MPPPPSMIKPNATIIFFYKIVVKANSKMNSKLEKNPLVCRACDTNPMTYSRLQFDQYSRLSIRLNIFFGFRPLVQKRIQYLEKSFPFLCRAR